MNTYIQWNNWRADDVSQENMSIKCNVFVLIFIPNLNSPHIILWAFVIFFVFFFLLCASVDTYNSQVAIFMYGHFNRIISIYMFILDYPANDWKRMTISWHTERQNIVPKLQSKMKNDRIM